MMNRGEVASAVGLDVQLHYSRTTQLLQGTTAIAMADELNLDRGMICCQEGVMSHIKASSVHVITVVSVAWSSIY